MFYSRLSCCNLKHSTPKILLTLPFRYLSILFYGSDDFSLNSLKRLIAQTREPVIENQSRISRLEVVCKGKDLPVKTFAEEHKLPIHLWPYCVPKNVFDVGVVVSFGHLIPKESIDACLHGMVNVHPSLLPRWRGAAPLHHTILHNDQVTGVTIVDVAPHRFDVGKILLQQSLPVPTRVTLSELSSLLADKGSDMLMRCLADLPGHRQRSWPQGNTGVTTAPKVKQELALVKWSSVTAHQLDCLYRGIPFPLFSYWKGRKVRLLDLMDPQQAEQIPFALLLSRSGIQSEPRPGTCVYDKLKKVLGVLTGGDRKWVAFGQLVCGSTMTARDFQNGFVSKLPLEQRFFTEDEEQT